MAGNYPLAFGELLAGSVLLERGVAAFKTGLSNTSATSSTSTGTAGTSSPSLDAPATPAGGYTRETFAAALLTLVGVKPTSQAIANMVRWETAEGGNWNNSASYNPLNTTLSSGAGAGGVSVNSVGVRAYKSWMQGLAATAQTLEAYPGILAALSGDAATFRAAVYSSPWGTTTGL